MRTGLLRKKSRHLAGFFSYLLLVPPVALRATLPAHVPPTRHVARGPGAVGIRPPRPNHPRKLHFRGARYWGTPPLDEELCSATVLG